MIEICILYCLIKREMTIYAIRKRIIELFGAFTKPSHGCIHPAIKKLKAAAMVSVQEILSEGGKNPPIILLQTGERNTFLKLCLKTSVKILQYL